MIDTGLKTEIVRNTRVLIHIEALRGNLDSVRKAIPPGTAICAAVKANAYGHGAPEISRILRNEGVEVLGVSSPFEGRELRDSGDTGRILVLGPTVPEEIPLSLETGLELMVTGERYLNAVIGALRNLPRGSRRKEPVQVHLKVDTGMGRVGCRPDEAVALARIIVSDPGLKLAGLTTHFPSADSVLDDDIEFTRNQAGTLKSIAELLRAEGISPGVLHAANSGGIALSPQTSFGMVRPGIALYGYGPRDAGIVGLKPVMELQSRITEIKKVLPGETVSYGRTWKATGPTWIATLPVGYADGYPRRLSNRAEVLIAGKRYPVTGTICMDQLMVNLGPETTVQPGDVAVFFGPQTEGPDAGELADIIGTISYEITCGIATRVPRVYVD